MSLLKTQTLSEKLLYFTGLRSKTPNLATLDRVRHLDIYPRWFGNPSVLLAEKNCKILRQMFIFSSEEPRRTTSNPCRHEISPLLGIEYVIGYFFCKVCFTATTNDSCLLARCYHDLRKNIWQCDHRLARTNYTLRLSSKAPSE